MFLGPITIGSVIFYVILCLVTGEFASRAGRSGGGWFLIALLITPLFAALFLSLSLQIEAMASAASTSNAGSSITGQALTSDAESRKNIVCPRCKKTIDARFGGSFLAGGSTNCPHCGQRITDKQVVFA